MTVEGMDDCARFIVYIFINGCNECHGSEIAFLCYDYCPIWLIAQVVVMSIGQRVNTCSFGQRGIQIPSFCSRMFEAFLRCTAGTRVFDRQEQRSNRGCQASRYKHNVQRMQPNAPSSTICIDQINKRSMRVQSYRNIGEMWYN